MRIYIKILLTLTVIISFVLCKISKKSLVEEEVTDYPQGRWETKTEWKVKMLKEWVLKKMYVPYWKKVWTPVEVREWIPYPSPPPGWSK